ncbi:phage holin family protein [Brevibacterium samyangense]|uniref:phage holin family protein n=1 Tax=Brevibacterium samyangense TaxID=366888 RepID=UPI0031D410CF
MRFLVGVLCNAAGLWVAAWLLPGTTITGSDFLSQTLGAVPSTIAAYLVLGLVFGLVNALVKPIVEFVSLPITCLTLGLFSLVVNVLMVLLTGWLSGFTPVVLDFRNLWWAVATTLVVWIASAVLAALLPDTTRARDD